MVIFESRFAGFGFTENLIDRKILAFSHYDDKINFISKVNAFFWKISCNQKKVE